eukprot:698656-Amphidinium_carterae.1
MLIPMLLRPSCASANDCSCMQTVSQYRRSTHCDSDQTIPAMTFGAAYTVFASTLTRHAGGILCVVRSTYIEKLDNVTWEIVLPGRVATLTLVRGAFTRRFVFVHLTPTTTHSWQHMCDLALSVMRHDCLSMLIGDVNVCSTLGDSVCSIAGEPKANFGSRTFSWRSATSRLSDLPSGLTHINKAKYLFSRIDRCLVNLPSDLLASTHAHGVVVGDTEPPLGSDHWPVRFFVVHDVDADHSGLPQWPLHHPDFPNLLEFHRAVDGLRAQSSFAEGYADLLTIVESATRDLQASRTLLPDIPRCNIPALMQYLHAVYHRAKRAAELLARATRDADVEEPMPDEFDLSQHHKANWAQLAFSTWQRQCAVEAVTVASASRVLGTDRAEAHATREHWSRIYGALDSMHPPSDVLAFTVPFSWDQICVDAQHIAGALHHARVRSASGPDGLAFGHLKLLESDVVFVCLLQLALDECIQHDLWPACFQDAVHVSSCLRFVGPLYNAVS